MEGQVQGNAEEVEAERNAIMENLENKFINMESDLKRLLNSGPASKYFFWNQNFREIAVFDELSFSSLIKDKTEEQFAKINAMFEEFKLNTITKAEFLSGIEDKADKDEIANIVSPSAFSSIIGPVDICLVPQGFISARP